tara:strand:+ start:689 stop:1777 length:1089 start_codon:yes stop_codon:yes gene_type:complete
MMEPVTPRGTSSVVLKFSALHARVMYQHGLMGGTFDRVHAGHLRLIREAFRNCKFLEIWITSDKIAQKKDWRCWSEGKRKATIKESLTQQQLGRMTFGTLEDPIGPAIDHPRADVIFCTSDTANSCEQINTIRAEDGIKPLDVIVVEHEKGEDGTLISSSKIRDGLIDQTGTRYITRDTLQSTRIMTDEVQSLLRDPFGKLHHGPEEDPTLALRSALVELNGREPIVSVGDVTTWGLLKIGMTPDIAIVDGMTKRSPWNLADEIDRMRFDEVIEVKNPAGSITSDLFRACDTAVSHLRSGRSSIVIVDGEEDLAPIPLHLMLPLGTMVLYGQPNKGIVARVTDLMAKENCRNIISQMARTFE